LKNRKLYENNISLSQLWKDFFRLRLISTLHYSKNDETFYNFISEGEMEAETRKDFKIQLVYCLICSQISLQNFQMNVATKFLKKSKEIFEILNFKITEDLKTLEDHNLVDFHFIQLLVVPCCSLSHD
jgi:hypothetical protein